MHWIIGDIHGMFMPLQGLLAEIHRRDDDPVICFTGDYINRGPQSRQVVDFLLALPNACFIRGNHDDLFDQIVNGDCYCANASKGDRVIAFRWFMEHGLDQTFASYGAAEEDLVWTMRRMSFALLQELIDLVPQSHRDFFRALPPVIERPEFFVAHGRWDPDNAVGAPMDQQLSQSLKMREELLWGRWETSEIDQPKRWSRPGYFGHTPVLSYPVFLQDGLFHPIRGDRMTLLDTAIALRPTGRLSAWCHEQDGFIQVSRTGYLAHSTVPE